MVAEIEVQRAIYGAISSLGLTTYDVAPQAADGGSTAAFPYVEIGSIILTEFDDFTDRGFWLAIRIHTRSRSGSMAQTKTIQGQIYDRLHRGALSISGFQLLDLWRETTECMRSPDGSFHGVCEYRGQIVTA